MLFLKAIFIGLCVAAPLGPMGVLCIQRSLNRGFRAGFLVGSGVACADAFYALLGALGLAGVLKLFPNSTTILQLAGGGFLVYLGWTMRSGMKSETGEPGDTAHGLNNGRQSQHTTDGKRSPLTHEFLSAFFLTLSNPLTILSFVGVFSAIGNSGTTTSMGNSALPVILRLVVGVFLGSVLWWLFLSALTSSLRTRMSDAWTRRVANLAAWTIVAFGVVQFMSGSYHVFNGG